MKIILEHGGEVKKMVYYFGKPTIGYCPKCDKIAEYNEQTGLYCPECKSENVSIFEWDGESEYPE